MYTHEHRLHDYGGGAGGERLMLGKLLDFASSADADAAAADGGGEETPTRPASRQLYACLRLQSI